MNTPQSPWAPPVTSDAPEEQPQIQQSPVDFQKMARTMTQHGKRAWGWQVTSFDPDQSELEAIADEQIADPTMQRYVVWRKSALMVAAPLLIVGSVLACISFKDIDTTVMNGFGVFIQVVQLLSIPILAVASIMALLKWDNVRESQKALLYGWGTALAIPLVTAAIPVSWMMQKGELTNEQVGFISSAFAVANGLVVLPVLATFPAGVIRGSLRAKGIVPTATLPGWFLLAAAPLYGLVLLSSLAMIGQIAGNALLIGGVLVLAAAPWYFVYRSETLVRPALSADAVKDLHRVQQIVGYLVLGGVAMIALWATVSKVNFFGTEVAVIGTGDDALFSPSRGVLQLVDLIGRWMITTIVYTHVFLQATVMSWKHDEELRSAPNYERHRRQLGWIDWVTGSRS